MKMLFMVRIMKPKFEVGDKVICIKGKDGNSKIINKTGTVIQVYSSADIGVEFDECVDDHNCNNNAKYGYGWYVPVYDLRHASADSIYF